MQSDIRAYIKRSGPITRTELSLRITQLAKFCDAFAIPYNRDTLVETQQALFATRKPKRAVERPGAVKILRVASA